MFAKAFFIRCDFNLYINNMLALFSIQYSKTEGLASSLDCRSLVQGVHHTIVAVELWLQLLLRNLRLAKNFLNMQSYDIINFFNPLAECSPSCWLIGAAVSMEISMTSVVHHTFVAAKVAFVMNLLINSYTILYLNLAECSLICCCLGASISLEKSSAISLEKMDNSIKVKERKVDKGMQELKKRMKPNFLLHLGMFQLYKQRGLSLVSEN